jgi:hypothetical protein
MINYLDHVDELEGEDLQAYKAIIDSEYAVISQNIEAFIRYPHATNDKKIIKIYEIIDFFSLDDQENSRIERMEFVADLLSIKELMERGI